jgi:peptide/nickel transport system permease protein
MGHKSAAVVAGPRSALHRAATGSLEGRAGVLLLTIVVGVVVLGPPLAPYSPTKIGVGPPLAGPSSAHWLGTDELGRDVLSRVLTGGASIIVVSLIALALTMVTGSAIGMASGYLGGRVDAATTRALDLLLAIPAILSVLVIAAGFGNSTIVLVIALALVSIPKVARVTRGVTRDLITREFIDAAHARGEHNWWILGREIMPNALPTLLVEVATRFTFTIVFVATLNFLGLGVQPPNPNWGLMVAEGRDYLQQAPLMALAPAAAIAVTVIGTHLFADSLTRELTGIRQR